MKIGNFETLQDFAGYAETFYLPLLDKLSEKAGEVNITEDERRRLSFLHDDLTSFCNSVEAEG